MAGGYILSPLNIDASVLIDSSVVGGRGRALVATGAAAATAAGGGGAAGSVPPLFEVGVSLGHLDIRITRQQYHGLISLGQHMDTLARRAPHTRLRPKCRPTRPATLAPRRSRRSSSSSSPPVSSPETRAWWKYATEAVLDNLRHRDDSMVGRRVPFGVSIRKGLEYAALWRWRKEQPTQSAAYLYDHFPGEMLRLQNYELELTAPQILLFRQKVDRDMKRDAGGGQGEQGGDSVATASEGGGGWFSWVWGGGGGSGDDAAATAGGGEAKQGGGGGEEGEGGEADLTPEAFVEEFVVYDAASFDDTGGGDPARVLHSTSKWCPNVSPFTLRNGLLCCSCLCTVYNYCCF